MAKKNLKKMIFQISFQANLCKTCIFLTFDKLLKSEKIFFIYRIIKKYFESISLQFKAFNLKKNCAVSPKFDPYIFPYFKNDKQ